MIQPRLATSLRVPVLALGLLATGCDRAGAGAGSAAGAAHPLVGSPAPELDLPAIGGGRASLEAARGKVVIVDFWATWCAPCRASFPHYQALAARHEGEVVVLGVSEDDDSEGIAEFAAETGARFPLAWDREKTVAARFEPGAMPTSFVIDRNGVVRHVHEGFRDGDEAALERVVSGLLR